MNKQTERATQEWHGQVFKSTVVVAWFLLYAQSCCIGSIGADVPVCILLISIFRSLLINFKEIKIVGIMSHSFHITYSGDKWWMHNYITFAQSVFSVADVKCTGWICFRIAEFGMWRFANSKSCLSRQHTCGFAVVFFLKLYMSMVPLINVILINVLLQHHRTCMSSFSQQSRIPQTKVFNKYRLQGKKKKALLWEFMYSKSAWGTSFSWTCQWKYSVIVT